MNPVFEFRTATNNVDPGRALIYMWTIYDVAGEVMGRYVGKASKGEDRPQLRYKMNVDRLLNGEPYRSSNPDGFRRVHHALATAAREKRDVELMYVCNVGDDEDINQVEQHYIKQYRCDNDDGIGLNGRRTVMAAEIITSNQMEREIDLGSKQAKPVVSEPALLADLETVRDRIQKLFPELKCEARSQRYSFVLDDMRLVRIKQAGPNGKVLLKRSITARLDKDCPEMDGMMPEAELAKVIQEEMRQYQEFFARRA